MISQASNLMSMNSKNKICIAAGGTGGHVLPALVMAEEFITKGYSVLFIGDIRFQNSARYYDKILHNDNFSLKIIDCKHGTKGYIFKIVKYFEYIGLIGIINRSLKEYKPDCVIGFGSYTSLLTSVASLIRRIPVFIHEQNSYFGLGNRLSAIWSKKIFTSFSNTHGLSKFFHKKIIFTGMPVRQQIRDSYYSNENPNINYRAIYRTTSRINIAIIGGSQGSSFFNKIIPDTIELLNSNIKSKICIYHQCGKDHVDSLVSKYEKLGLWYHVNTFFPEVAKIMSMSHLVISRSGAGSVAELSIAGSPTLFIPYKHAANNHQLINAKNIFSTGGCLLVEENNITPQKLAQIMNSAFQSSTELLQLSTSIKRHAVIDAHLKIFNEIDSMLNGTTITMIQNRIGIDTNGVGCG